MLKDMEFKESARLRKAEWERERHIIEWMSTCVRDAWSAEKLWEKYN